MAVGESSMSDYDVNRVTGELNLLFQTCYWYAKTDFNRNIDVQDVVVERYNDWAIYSDVGYKAAITVLMTLS